jgi:hypothetical protein
MINPYKENLPGKKINSASCAKIAPDEFNRRIARKLILPGEISSMQTFCTLLRAWIANKYFPEEKRLRVFLFTDGTGNIKQYGKNFRIDELSLFVPDIHRAFTIASGEKDLAYLEMVLLLSAGDLLILDERAEKFPYFVRYAECRQYDENNKSAKTVGRIILPEDIVPRLCIGSVQTSGPDEVAAHTHPMLEQLFFGLPGNDVVVMADSAEARFLEKDLLHIPLGSMHGTKVAAGKDLHYVWIDLFHSMEDMGYITSSHILKDE